MTRTRGRGLVTGADAADLASLHVGDLTPDAATVCLAGQTLPIPVHARSLIRAMLIQRHDQDAGASAALFTGRLAGQRTSDQTIRRLLEHATLQAGIAIAGTRHAHRPAAWLAEHGLTLERLPVPPPKVAPP